MTVIVSHELPFNRTYVYTASAVDGTWTKRSRINNCYYDAGLLIDDNDTMYVAYGNTTISVAQLSADGLSQVRAQQVFSTPSSVGTLEGARFYKRNGYYYIWLTRPANGQYVLCLTSPFGPYEMRQVLLDMPGPISGGGVPHQGCLVQTQNGAWYYMAFVDAYPGGRIWLRANADVRPGSGRQARFSYSTDGVNFTALGSAFALNNSWRFFMGYRFGIFNYATQALGGSVTVRRFDLTTP
ncbi:family 43 glycosylhydrolase [Acrocarpospora catenulata]|uniref:family 43 glycosylhydrolase n=1 Tax=Acrocarpospora catenulata TaxID=2836182 RepID=UPI001BD9657C|nr:family 43 glycosylhydrolase [Acrocarpospora catenulata]